LTQTDTLRSTLPEPDEEMAMIHPLTFISPSLFFFLQLLPNGEVKRTVAAEAGGVH